jgi:hypothetical protein
MKFNRSRIEKAIKILERLRYNVLKILQIIGTIKRFALPRFDYSTMNSVMRITELG